MEIFLMAPPNEDPMCPLKWEKMTKASAFRRIDAAWTEGKWRPPPGISTTSRPSIPSPIRTGQPRYVLREAVLRGGLQALFSAAPSPE